MKKIKLPLKKKDIVSLKAGDRLLLSGIIYTARDQAHKRMVNAIKAKKSPPLELKGNIIYYCGPTPTPPGKTIGSCGPTTSKRMDEFTPMLLSKGIRGVIGKGERSAKVINAFKRYKAVYFIAAGGAGAYLAKCVKSSKIVGYKDLGAEAIHRLEVIDFPLIVCVDSKGNYLYRRK